MWQSSPIRFGTSTWAYPGWQGQVYHRHYHPARFPQECLEEYCQYQYNGELLFRTVGHDGTFYRPPTADQLRHYLKQIPPRFEMCFKVWEDISIPRFAPLARYGSKAGQVNPRFLDAALFIETVLAPYYEAKFSSQTGPFILEFQRHDLSASEFCSRLDTFLRQLPTDFRYAVEIRNDRLLGQQYWRVLERHAVAHVYNHWSWMPSLMEQHHRLERFPAPFVVLRLLTPRGITYEQAKRRAEPYTKIVQALPTMRRDAVTLIRQAVEKQRQVYVLVNNRCEGNAPMTIEALADLLEGSPRLVACQPSLS
jgi:uncharacterized protein YecE (DUF72 family)